MNYLEYTASCDQKPSILINASAIGIYPTSKGASHTEKSKEVDKGLPWPNGE